MSQIRLTIILILLKISPIHTKLMIMMAITIIISWVGKCLHKNQLITPTPPPSNKINYPIWITQKFTILYLCIEENVVWNFQVKTMYRSTTLKFMYVLHNFMVCFCCELFLLNCLKITKFSSSSKKNTFFSLIFPASFVNRFPAFAPYILPPSRVNYCDNVSLIILFMNYSCLTS